MTSVMIATAHREDDGTYSDHGVLTLSESCLCSI
jgi:hypothetical protein